MLSSCHKQQPAKIQYLTNLSEDAILKNGGRKWPSFFNEVKVKPIKGAFKGRVMYRVFVCPFLLRRKDAIKRLIFNILPR